MKDINFKEGFRRIAIVFIAICCLFWVLIILFNNYINNWLLLAVIFWGYVAYGVYLLIEKTFIWIKKGFEVE